MDDTQDKRTADTVQLPQTADGVVHPATHGFLIAARKRTKRRRAALAEEAQEE